MAARRKTAVRPIPAKNVVKRGSKKTVSKKPVVKTAEQTKAAVPVKTEKVRLTKKQIYILAAVLGIAALIYLARGLFVAATVNGYPVTRLELVKELEKAAGRETLDTLITKRLIIQEAKNRNITVSETDINTQLDEIKKSVEAQGTTLEDALALQGQSMETFRESLLIQQMVEKIFGSDIQVTDDAVNTYYEQNKDLYESMDENEVRSNIREQLVQQEMVTRYRTWLTQARAEADIKYFIEL